MLTLGSLIIFLSFVSLPRVALAPEPASRNLSEPIIDKNENDFKIESQINKRLFIKLFVSRRKEHVNAVRNIRRLLSYEKQYKIIMILAENAVNAIKTGRALIEEAKLLQENSAMLKNGTLRDALSTILENSALLGDFVLQLPEITKRIIKNEEAWNSIIKWSLEFVDETENLLDDSTIQLFNLVRQELNIIPRDPSYTNPFWSRNDKKISTNNEKSKKKNKAKGNKQKKGPKLVNIEL